MKAMKLFKKYTKRVLKLRFHRYGSTWKYTLDVYKLRICWWRVRKINRLGFEVPVVGIGWG